MIITDIVACNKTKSKIYIDHDFAFVLYKGEIFKYHLVKDQVIDQKVYEELTTEVLPKRAKLRAMNLLTKRPYTEEKLRQKLKEGLYAQQYIDLAIEYVKSFGYINDDTYARDFVAYHCKDMSRKQMEQKLLAKGIKKDLISRIIEEEYEKQTITTDSNGENTLAVSPEEEQIQKLFQKKYKAVVPTDAKEYAKMMNFFMRKGYSFATVKRALSAYQLLDDLYNY